MFSLMSRSSRPIDLLTSKLLNEETFYSNFLEDIDDCFSELVIESPFVTSRRLDQLSPMFKKLKDRKVRVIINTRDPLEQDEVHWRDETHKSIANLQRIGVQVLYTDGHHRKLAIIDRHILYEGSLNVLSQNNSCEVMRRIESTQLAWQMVRFIEIDKFLN